MLNFSEFERALRTDGGFTVNPRTGEAVTTGISVAPIDNERKFTPATASDIEGYHGQQGERFQRGASLGGWAGPEGKDYLDTPTVYPHSPGGGGESRARKQMVKSDQIAGFDLDTFTEKHNPFHPEGREEMGLPPHELAGPSREGMSVEERRRRADFAAAQPEVQAWINSPRMRPPGRT